MRKIKYLCEKISEVEWSGLLIYKVIGDVTEPTKCTLDIVDIVPMDKGSSAYTEYVLEPEVIMEYFMEHPEYMDECSVGHIHSHNKMDTFFSGTDMAELHDNSPNHNMYLSLIVNNEDYDKWMAMLAFKGTVVQHNIKFLNQEGDAVEIGKDPTPKDMLVMYNCNIIKKESDIKLSEEFLSGVERIMKPKYPARTVTYSNWNNNQNSVGKSSAANAAYPRGNQGAKTGRSVNMFQDDEFAEMYAGYSMESAPISSNEVAAHSYVMELLQVTAGLDHCTDISDIADTIATRFPKISVEKTLSNIAKTLFIKYQQEFRTDFMFKDYSENTADSVGFINDALLEITQPKAEELLEGIKKLIIETGKQLDLGL